VQICLENIFSCFYLWLGSCFAGGLHHSDMAGFYSLYIKFIKKNNTKEKYLPKPFMARAEIEPYGRLS